MKTKLLRFLLFSLIILTGAASEIYGQSRQKNTKNQQDRRNEKTANNQLFNGKNLSNSEILSSCSPRQFKNFV